MRRKKDRSNGITALYERLSRDDDNAGESNSIVHQKQMLEDYAIKHGFTNLVHFTDDGWSGACLLYTSCLWQITSSTTPAPPAALSV